jgi:hypothetical protein
MPNSAVTTKLPARAPAANSKLLGNHCALNVDASLGFLTEGRGVCCVNLIIHHSRFRSEEAGTACCVGKAQ